MEGERNEAGKMCTYGFNQAAWGLPQPTEPWYKEETKAPCEEWDVFICRPDEKETGPVLYIVAT